MAEFLLFILIFKRSVPLKYDRERARSEDSKMLYKICIKYPSYKFCRGNFFMFLTGNSCLTLKNYVITQFLVEVKGKIKPLINDAEAQKNASFKIKISYGRRSYVKRDN